MGALGTCTETSLWQEKEQKLFSRLSPFCGLQGQGLLWGFLQILYVVIKSKLLHFILPQSAHL